MITVEEAVELIKKNMPVWRETEASLENLSALTTAEPLIADRDYPPLPRVMMDGIAVSYEVFQTGKRSFPVAGICPAGNPQGTLTDHLTCLEVMTGAPLPVGADLVIQYEHIKIENGVANIVVEQERAILESVHRQGSDCKAGDILLQKGEILNGPHWGIAASLGFSKIKIGSLPRINIISTGDELVPVDSTPMAHQIRRSNAYALKASLKLFGYDDVEMSHLLDNETAIEKHYEENAPKFDLMIYSGGVSKGKFDYLPSVWKKMGAVEIFHGVSQRPGKPLWFGLDSKQKTAILGLPGNPVSSLVCLHRYFLSTKTVYAKLEEEIVFKNALTFFVPVKITSHKDGTLTAMPLKIQNSGEFSALAGSDGILELPKDQSVFPQGEAFLFHSWGQQ
ncbi:MAG: molybdopterin molybdotransferase MoeA [Rhizobacter sp.]|nr:molybdopterin molybdotransferase MoeA [Bacteriovorax sp.]